MPSSDQCVMCRHFRLGMACVAFPDGIPDAISDGTFDHTEPYEGDNGIRYEPWTEDDRDAD